MVRESAELASLVAAERAGIPHVHVCIGMHEVLPRFAEGVADPLAQLGRMAGLRDWNADQALASETVFSSVPTLLDHAAGDQTLESLAVDRGQPRTDQARIHGAVGGGYLQHRRRELRFLVYVSE